jgi:hypothetical protein
MRSYLHARTYPVRRYNIVDTSDEGIVLEKGDVLVGMELPTGEKIRMQSHLSVDGKTAWDELIKDNTYSFGGVYKVRGCEGSGR